MKARDVMVAPVMTVKPYSSIKAVADLFWNRRISGAPVVNDNGKIVGMISEGDLVYRSELKTDRPHPYWFLQLIRVAAESTSGVRAINNHLVIRAPEPAPKTIERDIAVR